MEIFLAKFLCRIEKTFLIERLSKEAEVRAMEPTIESKWVYLKELSPEEEAQFDRSSRLTLLKVLSFSADTTPSMDMSSSTVVSLSITLRAFLLSSTGRCSKFALSEACCLFFDSPRLSLLSLLPGPLGALSKLLQGWKPR